MAENVKQKGIEYIKKYPAISGHFFQEFSNENRAFRILSEETGLTNIHKCLKIWKDAKFLEKKESLIERKGKKTKRGKISKNIYPARIYRFNFEPFLFSLFASEKLDKKEKNILNFLFNTEGFRGQGLTLTISYSNILEIFSKLYIAHLYIPYLQNYHKKIDSEIKKIFEFSDKEIRAIVNYSGDSLQTFIEKSIFRYPNKSRFHHKEYFNSFLSSGDVSLFESDWNNYLIFYSHLKKLFPKEMEKLDNLMFGSLGFDALGLELY